MDVHKIGRKEGRQADKISLLTRCPDSLAPCAPAELKSERWQLLTTDAPPRLATLAQWELWHRGRKTRPHRHLCSPGTGLPLLRRSLISGHKLAVRSAMFSARPPSSKLCPFGGCSLSSWTLRLHWGNRDVPTEQVLCPQTCWGLVLKTGCL